MSAYTIIGGAGFIGSNLTKQLVDDGHSVHVIDSLTGGKKEHVPKSTVFSKIDIRDYAILRNTLDKVSHLDGIFHLAAVPRVQYSIEHPIESNEHNVGGTVNVLTAAEELKVKRVVYSASSSAYGNQRTLPLVETMISNPLSPYGLQKYIGELYCRLYSDIYSLETVCLRYFNVYGPGLDPEGPYALVIGKFLKQRSDGVPMTITGDGNQTRDFTHVRDVVRANILAMKSAMVGKGEVINIGAGNNKSINELAQCIGGKVEYISSRIEPRDTRADIKRAKALLAWEPQEDFEEGIKELKKLFKVK